MKVTLRQAHKLVDKIGQRLATLRISAATDVNIWEVTDPVGTFDRLKQEMHATIGRQITLLKVRQQIRDGIRIANTKEVDQLVANRKALMDQLSTVRHVLSTVNTTGIGTASALEGKIAAARAASEAGATTGGYRVRGGDSSDAVQICLLTAEEQDALDKQISKMQLDLEATEDLLTSANSNRDNLISISADTLVVLREEGVVL